MKVKKYKDFKKDQQQVLFSAKSLLKSEDEKPNFKTSIEDQEKIEKEFQKELDKIEKYESFITINIDHVDNIDYESDWQFGDSGYEEGDDYEEGESEESEVTGCGCCIDCTGEEGCYCECEDCRCNSDENDVMTFVLSENLKWHVDNSKSVTENVFRPGSKQFFQIIKEARKAYEFGIVELSNTDSELFESTDIGKFGWFNGELVPLDLPMENITELNEAEYKGKEVELNHPMRNTRSGKKYYVYVKNPKTKKVIRVNFGDVKGGLTAKVSDPEARKNFASRHKCSTKKDKTKAGYWACRINRYGHLWNNKSYPGFW
jgi:hypothetical protein